MSKIFNTSADCKSSLHYMVNIQDRLENIKAMIDKGDYFTINCARQYGKTTTLKALANYLGECYTILSLDFQKLSHKDFETEYFFVKAFSRILLKKVTLKNNIPSNIQNMFQNLAYETHKDTTLADLFDCLGKWCEISEKPLVLIIDEVDSATNNQVFLDFLSQIRAFYIDRDETATFQSVILAGVYDIKNLKIKFSSKDDHRLNSPWNIASDFLVDMSFSIQDIAGMLKEYESDYHTGMNITEISEIIFAYTSGYPYLISRLCKLLDERIAGSEQYRNKTLAWTKNGILAALRILLTEQNTLFESLINKLDDYPELKELLQSLLFNGKEIVYVVGIRSFEIALMFGFVKKLNNNTIIVANRIFEILLYNLFLTSPEMQRNNIYDAALKDKNQFIKNGHLNMDLILEKFILHFNELYGSQPQAFLEEDARRYFLLYLRPIINGTGNYYIESQTRNRERTDVIVDYSGEQFIIELKIWRGNVYHECGKEQLSNYLNYYHLKKGYLITFSFNKNKQAGINKTILHDKLIIEAVI